jgi:flagellar biosynthesis chaperone FliJ
MPFVYRLQKILDFRIRKKEEQLLVLQKAQHNLYLAEENIRRNNEEIEVIKLNQRTADYKMMEYYDKYLHHLWEKAEQLEVERRQAEEIVQIEMQKLIELEQAVKVLEKHKEKNREAYLAEEKSLELKNYSELGVQRYFQQTRDAQEAQEEQELLKQMQELEENYQDEY